VFAALLNVASPLQDFVAPAGRTHAFINWHAAAILSADGREREASWLLRHLRSMNAGSDWADSGWKCVYHMYDPRTGIGFRGWPSARDTLRDYWAAACDAHARSESERAAFYLGAAAHIAQDLCVPHHAAATALAGHKRFEQYAQRYRHRYATHSGGTYDVAASAEGWAMANASHTREWYSDCLTHWADPGRIHQALTDLLPRAQRTTAGFVTLFLTHREAI
jgi:phospholipase C